LARAGSIGEERRDQNGGPIVLTMRTPGVYIQEVPSGVRTITGVSTSTTAFVGRTRMGPVERPTQISSFAEYDAIFGGLWDLSPLSFSVQQYFQNGGQTAVIVRVDNHTGAAATASRFAIPSGGPNPLLLDASSPGTWGDNLQITLDADSSGAGLFNITASDPRPAGSGASETVRNLSTSAANPRFLTPILAQQSRFLRVANAPNAVNNPTVPAPPGSITITKASAGFVGGSDGGAVANGDVNDAALAAGKRGMYALEDQDIFNLLVIPPLTPSTQVSAGTWSAAATYCRTRRAFLIIDPPSGTITSPADAAKAGHTTLTNTLGAGTPEAQYAGYFFPRFRAVNPLTTAPAEFAPSGAIAGIYAKTDATRGVWKAPAGLEAGLNGILDFVYPLTEGEIGTLNQVAVNCLRSINLIGPVVWGARTLAGADALASDWKYVPVRRVALYIEESLYRGTQWVVFEPNDEPLWGQIRLSIGAFMQNLFRQGAFQGRSPREAYFVKCDRETTTQNDINLGVVNILVGFAPLKPAEFVLIRIQQMAGQVQV
jgi:phage tail sheath protein FI